MPSRALIVTLLAVAPAACGGSGAPVRARVTAGHGDGIRYVVPAGWHVARNSLTPHLLNPREVLTVGTGRLPAGGACAQNPGAALAALRPADVLLSVLERFGSDRSFPARPRRFTLPPTGSAEAKECAGPGARFATHWFQFRDGGRGFYVLAAVGPAAPAARVREALAILDSLKITPRRPVRIDSDLAEPYDDRARGLHLVLPVGWRVYRQTLTRAIAARHQLAFGTFALRQRAPDPNCTPSTALSARPRGGGFVFVSESGPRSGFPPRPPRLHPTFARPECFGRTWRVSFRDRGRDFDAYIYGRRRQALAILDSLRVDRRAAAR